MNPKRLHLLAAALFIAMYAAAALPHINIPDCLVAKVEYELTMPNADDPVLYEITLQQQSAPADTLAPCSYLIVSRPAERTDAEESFSAYFEGNFFRFRGGKMTEWHFDSQAEPFAAGIQRSEMFTPLLPSFIEDFLASLPGDSTYIYNVEESGDQTVIKGAQTRQGYRIREFEYRLLPDGRPSYYEMTTNPGETTELVVTAHYDYSGATDCTPLSEEYLAQRFPEAFEKFRSTNFSLKSLIGKPMPTFSAPTAGKERLTHLRGNGFDRTTLIAVLDTDSDAIAQIREGVKAADVPADIIYAFTGNNSEAASAASGVFTSGETVVYSARSLVRDCGITALPSLIVCDSDGIITKIHAGANNDLRPIVINLLTFNP